MLMYVTPPWGIFSVPLLNGSYVNFYEYESFGAHVTTNLWNVEHDWLNFLLKQRRLKHVQGKKLKEEKLDPMKSWPLN